MCDERVTLLGARSASEISSSRPVKETGWKAMSATLSIVRCSKFDDRADASLFTVLTMVVTERDLDADAAQVLDRLQLHVEEVADAAVLVVLVVTPSNCR